MSSTLRDCQGNPHCVYELFILTPCPQTPGTENNPLCDKNQCDIARVCTRRAGSPAWRLLAVRTLAGVAHKVPDASRGPVVHMDHTEQHESF